ncbi:MAG: DNA topoisomerase (ATP-hydrolyzing) subunit B [Candidatus Omnitrophica bacterium]|nr:DNA topoisomerase (ATP-hydrolyzing) subunit B [Candidatus Omnitrophota bacterium]
MEEKDKIQAKYDATNIQVLSGIEAVRKRPAMYIGDTSIFGLHHLVYEVVDNSIDECLVGFCNSIEVVIHSDNSVSVDDNGRGIPVDIHKTENKPAVEVVLTMLHAGGKFDKKTYRVSGGLHGVGVSVVNALSEWLEVEIKKDGQLYHQKYEKGLPVSKLKIIGKTKEIGTKVTFKPDPEIFETIEFDDNILANRLRELAFLNPGIVIKFDDERKGRTEKFQFGGGLVSFVEELNKNKTLLFTSPIYFKKTDGDTEVEIALQYNDGYNETILSFVNNVNTREGGTHLTGFRSGLTRSINEYGKKYQLLEADTTLGGEDIREGLTAVISLKIPEPQFEGQTKTKLGNSSIKPVVESSTFEKMYIFLEEHPECARDILNKSLTAYKAREAARKARELTRKKLSETGSLPGKLADCSSKDPKIREIFIVEGDSAGGSAKQGRDRLFQAILPLKGKIINTEKARLDKVLGNNEIRMLISAIGAGYGEEFDVSKLRYSKVIIMTDADVDGAHIRTLLLTFFYRQMPELIKQGYCYIAQPPLYKVKKGKKEMYVETDTHMENILLDLGSEKMEFYIKHSKKQLTNAEVKKIAGISKRFMHLSAVFDKKKLALKEYMKKINPKTGFLPAYKIDVNGKEYEFYSDDELSRFMEKNQLNNSSLFSGTYKITEIFESRECEKIISEIKKLGLDNIFWEEIFILKKDTGDYEIPFEKLFDELKENGKKGLNIQRYKGLGEMNPQQLWETTMDVKSRMLKKITIEDAIKAEDLFTILMGEQVEPRKNFIYSNALEAKNIDI